MPPRSMIGHSAYIRRLMIWTTLVPKLTPLGTSGCNANHINARFAATAKSGSDGGADVVGSWLQTLVGPPVFSAVIVLEWSHNHDRIAESSYSYFYRARLRYLDYRSLSSSY